MLPKTIHILMQGTPEGIVIDDVVTAMQQVKNVINVHHVHIWQLDEHQNALEAHVLLADYSQLDEVKGELKTALAQKFSIGHSTLEFEINECKYSHC
jgi:cobalt-zinc-cadmium efflux system protein